MGGLAKCFAVTCVLVAGRLITRTYIVIHMGKFECSTRRSLAEIENCVVAWNDYLANR